ncbi:MAG: A/G-specific adenine glycosylase [Myxococcota bacterium]
MTNVPPATINQTIQNVSHWFTNHARALPWRQQRTAYRVWLAEIMLQQTQVSVVIDYFQRFVSHYPDVTHLAQAPIDNVLALWSGLGFYSRGRNLHRAAQMVVQDFNGQFPQDLKNLMALPGVGSYTAGAILAFAYHQPAAVVDGNVARVLSRLLADDTCAKTPAGKRHFEAISLQFAKQTGQPAVLQEGLMELGALVCKAKNPLCHICPVQQSCRAYATGQVHRLPISSPAIQRTNLQLACALIHTPNRLWLERRSNKGLFGGLYEPPSCPLGNKQSPQQAVHGLLQQRNIPCNVKRLSVPVVVQRTLSHRNLVLHGVAVLLQRATPCGQHWIDPHQVQRVGLSRAVQQLLRKTLPQHPCLVPQF